MSDWQLHINVKEAWAKSQEEETVGNLRLLVDALIKELNRIKPVVEQKFPDELDGLEEIIDEFESILADMKDCDIDDYPDYGYFNYTMDKLYDWGDIRLDNKFPFGKKLCWIGTVL